MSLQTIIDRAQSIEIDRRRIVAQTVSRSQRIKISERASAQPWRWTVAPPGMLKWSDSRGIVELIDFNDRANEYTLSLNNNASMNYITQYQGGATTNQLTAMQITSFTTSTMVIGTLPSVSTSTIMFASGDLIQPTLSRYPYTVVNTVYRGSGNSISLVTHRPAITSENVTLTGSFKTGTSCTWRMVLTALPSYSIVPKNLVQFNGDFKLIEKII
jgi:hypothetical protein